MTVTVKTDMQNDNQSDSGSSENNPRTFLSASSGGQKVIQPSAEFVKESEALQISQPAHPVVADTIEAQSPQPIVAQSIYPQPGVSQADVKYQNGASAESINFGQTQESKGRKFKLKPLIAGLVVIFLVGGGYTYYRGLTSFSTKTVQGNGFSYTVTYNKISSTVSMNGKTYLQGRDKSGHAMLLYVGKVEHAKIDCHAGNGSTISVIETPSIEGEQHNLCYSRALNIYDINFTHDKVWYFLTVFPKDKNQTLDQDTIKMIAKSVKIQ